VDFELYVQGLEELKGQRGPESVIVLPRVESTNVLARSIIAEYEAEDQVLHPLVVLALEQTGGRGRFGRVWASPRGKGVYASMIVPVASPEPLQTLPLLVGVGLCRALSPYLPSPCRLKWPNDLLVEEGSERRKIGGVLIEALVRQGEGSRAVVGFGVNHGHGASDLPETGTSLHLEGCEEVTLPELTWALITGVERELEHLGDATYAVESYRDCSVHRPGEPIAFRLGETVIEGTFVGFDENGLLILESAGRELRFPSGEVIEP
jgi:BirA family transcriptional regulator, biotin operon repressor / biotin---[acetyl-CoA-carboxylase] ligase